MKVSLVSVLILCANLLEVPASAQSPRHTLTAESIIDLAFAGNPGIRAARYRLESAQHNYDLFESELSQFTPLVLDSRMVRDTDAEKRAEVTAGMEREFFNGAAAAVSVGNSSAFQAGASHSQFVESEIEFPLFSSNTKLERLSERTFEENDLREARLNYISEVRQQIETAQETFYEWTEATAMIRAHLHHRKDLEALLASEEMGSNDRAELLDRIRSIVSDIGEWELRISTREIQLVELLAVARPSIAVIEEVTVNISAPDHLGRHYVAQSFEQIFQRALKHDTETQVLQRVIENAEEKVRLAERGKWDITVALSGRYNYAESRVGDGGTYAGDVGLRLRKFDRKVLRHARSKALADVRSAKASIDQREAQLRSRIGEHKVELDNIIGRLRQLAELRRSRSDIYAFKRANYLTEEITIDELLNASRNLLRAEADYNQTVAEYLRTIRSLDSLCGVYFTRLGIDINRG